MDTLESRKPRNQSDGYEAPELLFYLTGEDRVTLIYTESPIHMQVAPLRCRGFQTLTGRLNKKIILKSGVRANSNHSTSRRGPLPFPASYPPVISTPFTLKGCGYVAASDFDGIGPRVVKEHTSHGQDGE